VNRTLSTLLCTIIQKILKIGRIVCLSLSLHIIGVFILLLIFFTIEIVYNFNPLTPLDLLPLLVNEKTSLDGQKKTKMVKKLHGSVQQHIEKKNEQYATKADKGHRQVIFEPGDWVWAHMRNERFLTRRRSKMYPRGDGPFQVFAMINNNAYKLDLPGEFNISNI
jgi:hypothetical protein